jgi:hypothetical protein
VLWEENVNKRITNVSIWGEMSGDTESSPLYSNGEILVAKETDGAENQT